MNRFLFKAVYASMAKCTSVLSHSMTLNDWKSNSWKRRLSTLNRGLQPKLALRASLFLAAVLFLCTSKVDAQSCTPLTLSNFPANTSFQIDDEEQLSGTNIQFLLIATINETTGAFTGYFGPASTSYSVSGTLTQVGSNGLSITFRYAVGEGIVNVYTYTGAIATVGSGCGTFVAGTYDITTILFESPISYRVLGTSGPFPFSGTAYKFY